MSETTTEDSELAEYRGATAGGDISWDYVLPNDLSIDPRVQRPRDEVKLRKMVAEFDPSALGQITVSRRANNSLIILDGQHRWLLVRAVDYGEPLEAKIFTGLKLEQEARLFRLLNNTTKASIMALFKVALSEGEPRALAVNDVVHQAGMTMSTNSFRAVGTALRIARRKGGIDALAWAIDVSQRAWGLDPSNVDGRVLDALSSLRLRHGMSISTNTLVDKLTKECASAGTLTGKAKAHQTVNAGQIVSSLAQVIVNIYNKSIKKDENKLPDWK
jgi:uncharacterized protein DUF6551